MGPVREGSAEIRLEFLTVREVRCFCCGFAADATDPRTLQVEDLGRRSSVCSRHQVGALQTLLAVHPHLGHLPLAGVAILEGEQSTPRDGGHDTQLVAILELGGQPVEKTNVLIPEVQIDEPSYTFVVY